MTEVAIEFEGVKYVYPDGTVALDEISLKILKGERVAIMGPNGAGKSTMVMLMNGLYTPASGNVKISGVPLNMRSAHEVRRRVGVVFQNPDDQLFCPTLWEDVAFGPLNMGLPKEEVKQRVREALEIVHLEGYEDKAPHHLSVGEKKRAAIAAVLAMKPEILVLDEPTINLDPGSRRELIEFLNKLHDTQGITLVLVTHDVNLAPMLVDRIYLLSKGKIVMEGLTHEIFSNPKLLSEANLELPVIAFFFKCLKERGYANLVNVFPLTVEEAVSGVLNIIKSEKPKKELKP